MNNLKIFNFDISDIKIGTEKVKAVMLGGRKHWPSVDEKQYFTLRANTDSVIKFSKAGLNYSIDDGKTWTQLNANVGIPLAKGKKMMFQGTPTGSSSDPYGIGSFSASTGTFEAEGNVMSLTYGTDFIGKTDLTPRGTFCLACIFRGCTSLVSAKNLLLPATTLTQQCYYAMFYGCSNLTEAPKLPSPTLATLCYQEMFRGCTSLEKAPELLVETPASQCYWHMFYGCSSLNEVTCMLTGNTTAHTENWLNGVAPVGKFHKNMENVTTWSRGVNSIPTSWCVDGVDNYLTFEAIEPATIKHTAAMYRSLDSGETWEYIAANVGTSLAAGEKVIFNAILTPVTGDPWTGIGSFSGSTGGTYKVYGNPKSLIYGDNFSELTPNKLRCFQKLFMGCTGLTDCSELVFPEYLEADDPYVEMFSNCTRLVSIPEYVGKDSRKEARWLMFQGCTSLEKAPKLPAETVATGDYYRMFYGCTKLNEIWCYAKDTTASNAIADWVYNVAPTGTFHRDSGNTQWVLNSNSGIPIGWELDPPLGYFTFVANEPSVVQFSKSGLSGSTDSGATWFALGTSPLPLNTGEELWLKSNITPSTSSPYGIGTFSASTGNLTAKGNIQSLNYADTMSGPVKTRSYSHLFDRCSAITDCEDLILPGTVAEACYDYMFYKATNLVKAPKILPATALTTSCYQGMFADCTSLEKSPILPAETLSNNCYSLMFSGCTNLKEVTCYGTNQNNSTANTQNWLAGVSPTGVFYKNTEKATSWGRGVYGIPFGWEVEGNDNYTTIVANEASTIKFNRTNVLYYSINNSGWSGFTAGTGVDLAAGDEMRITSNGIITPQTASPWGIGQFSGSTGNYALKGNIMSLMYGDNYQYQTVVKERGVMNAFSSNSGLTSIDGLEMPGTSLGLACYQGTFSSCGIASIPSGLLQEVTTMGTYCYNNLFSYCTNLVDVPLDLLPSTTTSNSCYRDMFHGCTSLEKAPYLPAEVLANDCYRDMFNGCTSLNEIWCSGITYNSGCCDNWVSGVETVGGKFHKHPEKPTNWSIGVNGIPTKWVFDPMPDYFTIAANAPSTIKFTKSGMSGSTDGGYTWFALGTTAWPLDTGEEMMLKSTISPTGSDPYDGIGMFSGSTGDFYIKGDVMSLLYGDQFTGKAMKTRGLQKLFRGCTALTAMADDFQLPLTATYCYAEMFWGCTNLTSVPKDLLPATTLGGNGTYWRMFGDCTGLTEAPILPAETLTTEAYIYMFQGCNSLSAITCYATATTATNCLSYWVDNVAPTGVFTKNRTKKTDWSRGVNGIPETWCVKDVKGYFELEAITDCVFKNSKSPYYYSVDSGETWALLPTSGVEISAGDSMILNAKIVGGTSAPYGIGSWSGSTGTYNAKGTALSLSKGDNFELDTNLVRTFELGNIFTDCTGLISAKDLKLPSMSLYQQCYYAMFWGCTNLIEAPELPALTVSTLCYQEMFRNCPSLEKAPVLPAETPVDRCYYYMFSGCTSLNEIWCSLTGNADTHTSGWTTGVAEYGTFHKNEEKATNWSRGVHGIPTKWGAGDPEKYLTIEAIEASTVKFTNSICRSLDNGVSWETLAANTATELAPGEKALYGGILGVNTSSEPYGVGTFSASTGNFKAYGPVLAMTWMDNSEQGLRSQLNFASMFRNCTAITDAEGIIFPPSLNQTNACYAMFWGCRNLVKAPRLTSDITKGGQTHYNRMFTDCTSLEEVPEDMLPSETLTAQCYYGMFSGCTSLVKAPKLPAKVLPSECYYQMFNGCTSLNEIWCSGTTYNSNCCYNWTLNVSPTGVFHKNLEEKTAWNRGPSGIPYTWEVDSLDDYFTIEAIEASQVRSSKSNWQYSIDGQPWSAMTAGAMIPLAAGEKMRIRSNGNISGSTGDERGNGCFGGSTGTFKASGNIKSLCLADNYDLQPILYRDSFTNLFKGCTALTSIEDVEFPTTLVRDDFPWAFSGCTRLTKVTILPAESATSYSHYWEMFMGCTALTEVPEDMLPSLTVGQEAYRSMFQGCTSLVKAPNLPATTLASLAYYQMFYGCSSLNEITCMFSGATSSAYTSNWVYGVAPVGKFHKNMNEKTTWMRGNNSIPATWSVPELDNYFAIKAVEPSVVKFSWRNDTFYYSIDEGTSWQPYTTANTAIPLEAGKRVLWNTQYGGGSGTVYSFSASTGNFEVEGNVMSFVWGDNYNLQTTHKEGAYRCMFSGCTALTSCENLEFTDAAMSYRTCDWMFGSCTNLAKAPSILPAMKLATDSYSVMFHGCTSLEKAPILPAETLVTGCYYNMFSGCTSLNEIWCYATNQNGNTAYTSNWVYGVSPTGVFHKYMGGKTFWNRGVTAIPSTWSVADNDNYFRFEAEEASSFKFSKSGLYYSVDSGETWAVCTANTAIEVAAGEEVWFNGVKTPDSSEPRGIGNFSASTGVFKVKGDAMSLLYGDNIDYQTDSKSYAFQMLLVNCTGLTDASDLILTATTLPGTDFYGMFSGCTSLVLPPNELPAKVISTYGYSHMFVGCTSLTKAPYIAATGYSGSFNCSHMFSGCTSLTEVQDELHPLTIGANMYDSMFLGCSSLEKAPYLPATVVNANNCYGWMFQDCTSLKYIKCGAVTIGGMTNWVSGVGSEGVFYRSPAASWSTGVSGIPSGWEVKLMSEDE